MKEEDRCIAKTVSLLARQWAQLEAYATKHAISVSAALRLLISQSDAAKEPARDHK